MQGGPGKQEGHEARHTRPGPSLFCAHMCLLLQQGRAALHAWPGLLHGWQGRRPAISCCTHARPAQHWALLLHRSLRARHCTRARDGGWRPRMGQRGARTTRAVDAPSAPWQGPPDMKADGTPAACTVPPLPHPLRALRAPGRQVHLIADGQEALEAQWRIGSQQRSHGNAERFDDAL